jgi:hypothetical protein
MGYQDQIAMQEETATFFGFLILLVVVPILVVAAVAVMAVVFFVFVVRELVSVMRNPDAVPPPRFTSFESLHS